MPELFIADDGQPRCGWIAGAPDFYLAYHDDEWGRPVHGDHAVFERLCLEGFQSGLSWRTVLAKRENFRSAFAGFEIEAVARFDEADVERLLGDAGIVRNRAKIEAVINNAGRAADLRAEVGDGALTELVWSYREGGPQAVDDRADAGWESRGSSPESAALSKHLKRSGWRFVGPTTVYACMQAIGVVNDHAPGCITRDLISADRSTRAGS
ncbi:MAG: DNA-3-methyladenine glycosylase I [Actinobacteria bacterium]|nr:DNA-3-methyladenine glycosylase I [Actinomycetota bacterium]